MKILLTWPPFYRFLGSHNNDMKIGVGILSAILRKKGHEVQQYNPDYAKGGFATQKELFERSDTFARDVTKPHHSIYKDVFDTVDKVQPDIVGISIGAGTIVQSEIIAKYCHDNGIHIIVGGPMVTLALDKMMEFPFYDQFVPGEAERVVVRAVEHPESKVVVGIPASDLNGLPIPDRNNFVNDTKETFYGAVITSRGCPFQCSYCAHWIMGGEIRYRTPQNIISEIRHVTHDYDQWFFRFFDDTFTLNRKRVHEFCADLIAKGPDIEFLVETRIDCLDEQLIRMLKPAGMVKVRLGIESGSPRILERYKEGYTVEKIRDTVALLNKYEVDVSANWMFGFPEETNEDLQMTIDLAREIDASWNTISSLAPYYGTEMFDRLPDEKKKDWKLFYHNILDPPLNDGLDETLIQEFLSINEGKKR